MVKYRDVECLQIHGSKYVVSSRFASSIKIITIKKGKKKEEITKITKTNKYCIADYSHPINIVICTFV